MALCALPPPCWSTEEDLDDLRMEGITDHVPSGSRFSQGRSPYSAEPQAKVTLNICSRCARFQGDSLMEESDDGTQMSHSPEQAVPDPCAASPLLGVERVMQDEEELESASQVSGARQPFWESSVLSSQSGGSLNQKQSKDYLASKELLTVEKHLNELDKDLAAKALTIESEMPRVSNIQSRLSMSSYHGSLSQTLLSQNSRPQTPSSLTGKDIPQIQGNKLLQSSSNQNSRTEIPNSQHNRPRTPLSQGSRPTTPNSQLFQSPLSSNPVTQGEPFDNPKNKLATFTSQAVRPIGSPISQTGVIAGNISQRSYFSEDESFSQLLATRQPWTLPSNANDEGVDRDQDKRL